MKWLRGRKLRQRLRQQLRDYPCRVHHSDLVDSLVYAVGWNSLDLRWTKRRWWQFWKRKVKIVDTGTGRQVVGRLRIETRPDLIILDDYKTKEE